MSERPIRAERGLLLCKTEVTEGTDAVPTPLANSLIPVEVTLTPDVNVFAKGRMQPSSGGRGGIAGRRVWGYDIAMPFAGAPLSAADVVPAEWAPLAKAADWGFTEVGAAPITGLDLAPVSKQSGASCTIYLYLFDEDGGVELHKLVGCRNNMVFSLGANVENMLRFQGMGLWSIPTNPADPGDPTYLDANGDFSILQGTAVTWASRTDRFTAIEIDMGWEVIADINVGSADGVVRIRLNRAPDAMASGSYDPERVLTSDYDKLSAIVAETQEQLLFTVVTAEGSSFAFTAQVQYQNPSVSSDQGMARWGQPFWLVDVTDGGEDYLLISQTHA